MTPFSRTIAAYRLRYHPFEWMTHEIDPLLYKCSDVISKKASGSGD